MAYERNTTEGIRSWLAAETSTTWNSSSIAKGLTEDVMSIIIDQYQDFDSKIRQGILLSTMYMRKGDLLTLRDGLNKVFQIALNDSDDFVKTTAHVLKDYPSNQQVDLNIDLVSDEFRSLLTNIGSSIKKHGFNFHPLEDMILQPSARTTPPHVSSTYSHCKSTHTHHFTLTTNTKDIISAESRHQRFSELVENEERSVQAEQQQAQAVAQKRAAGHELQSNKAKRINSNTTSPTSNMTSPFAFPPSVQQQQPVRPVGMMRQNSLGNGVPAPGANSLFTKRPSRQAAPSGSGGGGLFVPKQKSPGQRTMAPGQRPMAGGSRPPPPTANLPRGLQRPQKTQMLDFSASIEFEQNTANALKKAQDEIKAKQDAKKQEALDRKQEALEKKLKAAAEKKEKEEQKRLEKAAAAQAKAEAAAQAKAEAAAQAKAEEEAREAEKAKAESSSLPQSPTSQPTSPKATSIKMEQQQHVFAVPALPAHYQQQQQQQNGQAQGQQDGQQNGQQNGRNGKTPPTEKLSTF